MPMSSQTADRPIRAPPIRLATGVNVFMTSLSRHRGEIVVYDYPRPLVDIIYIVANVLRLCRTA
jgi:hypothetical protein